MSQVLKATIRWAEGQIPSNYTRRKNHRILASQFAEDVSHLAHGNFVQGLIKFASDSVVYPIH